MSQKQKIYTGVLTQKNAKTFLVDSMGKNHLENEKIWDGYIAHWRGFNVNARFLPQRDYETGGNIVLLWPYKEPSTGHFVELYYNERLVKYPFSLLGHFAININGAIYNYSHLMNENEIISEEEYFFRPALGEFAPHPVTGRYDVHDKTHPYYDRFGRNFMRTIHVLRIEGLDTGCLNKYCNKMLQEILNAPDPRSPDHYSDFSILTRSCVTIIRDGLRHSGFKEIRGIFPRDFFINAAFYFNALSGSHGLRIALYRMPQLKVPEALYSAPTIIANPVNWLLMRKLPDY